MADGQFDFKIREELKKMTEYKNMTNRWTWWLRKDVPVTVDMFIDMITYSSKGDLDTAARGLRASEQFLERCWELSITNDIGRELMLEVWRASFITTRCVLDWGADDARQEPHGYRVLEGFVDGINALHNLLAPMSEKRQWLKLRIQVYKEKSLLYNTLWKQNEEIAKLKKRLQEQSLSSYRIIKLW